MDKDLESISIQLPKINEGSLNFLVPGQEDELITLYWSQFTEDFEQA